MVILAAGCEKGKGVGAAVIWLHFVHFAIIKKLFAVRFDRTNDA